MTVPYLADALDRLGGTVEHLRATVPTEARGAALSGDQLRWGRECAEALSDHYTCLVAINSFLEAAVWERRQATGGAAEAFAEWLGRSDKAPLFDQWILSEAVTGGAIDSSTADGLLAAHRLHDGGLSWEELVGRLRADYGLFRAL